ncbi:hypothetical protein F4677DRAFT_448347 [Hypoxylon crocopeplum]|nr:hypothetical protein F4677DRAFT_448347 [Hypoxylon crocopeplum]
MTTSYLSAAVAGIAVIYAFAKFPLRPTQDAKEPPHNAESYNWMRDKYSLPIYTLWLPSTKMYVVYSTSPIPVVRRQFRALAFGPIEAATAKNVMGASDQEIEITKRD